MVASAVAVALTGMVAPGAVALVPVFMELTRGVGTRVMVVGMPVTMPGFWGTLSAQIPVK